MSRGSSIRPATSVSVRTLLVSHDSVSVTFPGCYATGTVQLLGHAIISAVFRATHNSASRARITGALPGRRTGRRRWAGTVAQLAGRGPAPEMKFTCPQAAPNVPMAGAQRVSVLSVTGEYALVNVILPGSGSSMTYADMSRSCNGNTQGLSHWEARAYARPISSGKRLPHRTKSLGLHAAPSAKACGKRLPTGHEDLAQRTGSPARCLG